MKTREYDSYGDYLTHQAAKRDTLTTEALEGYGKLLVSALIARLGGRSWRGASVLCLGARMGSEVRAFIDLGAFAVGVDVNPGPQNAYVVWGDFHRLNFAAQSLDAVYTNALDHVHDLSEVAREVRRVLKPDGVFLVDAVRGEAEGGPGLGAYESLAWATVDELVAALEREGLVCLKRQPITAPWAGEHLTLELAPDADCTQASL